MNYDIVADKKACKLVYGGGFARDYFNAWKTIAKARYYDFPFHLYRESLIREAREDWPREELEAALIEHVTYW